MASARDSKVVGGLLLTGGASRRMGFDKATIEVDGVALAVRIGTLLASVAEPAFEVGPGASGLPIAPESTPGAGPLAALADGVRALRAAGYAGPALVLATDLAMIDAPTLHGLADWRGDHSVVPVDEGLAQPLCARWSAADLDAVTALVAAGERSLRPLLTRPHVELTHAFESEKLWDADTPEDLDVLGIDWRRP